MPLPCNSFEGFKRKEDLLYERKNWQNSSEISAMAFSKLHLLTTKKRTAFVHHLLERNHLLEVLREHIAVFCRNYVKPQLMVTADHKLQQLVVNLSKQKLIVLINELQARIRNSCSCHYRRFLPCKKAATAEEHKKPGPLGERYIWTDCHTAGWRAKTD